MHSDHVLTKSLLRRITLSAVVLALIAPGCGGGAGASLPDGGAPRGGDAAIATSDDGGPAPATHVDVHGAIVDPDGAPLAGRIVLVDGRTTTTDAEGQFTFEHVEVPYDVLTVATGSTNVRVAAGLTTSTPTIAAGWRDTLRETTFSATITGLPAPSASADDLVGFRSQFNAETFSRGASNTLSNQLVRWYGPATATHDLMVLRYTSSPDGHPLAYQGLGTTSVALTGGMPASGLSIAAVDPSEVTLHATAPRLDGALGEMITVHVAAAGASVQVARFDDTESIDVVMPSGAGLSAGVSATLYMPEGVGMRFVQGLSTSATDVSLDVPAPPHLVSPAMGAMDVAPGDEISWTWSEDGFYVVQIGVSDGALGWSTFLEVRTTSTSYVIPDLEALGLPWVAGRALSVWVYAFDLERSADDVPTFDFDGVLGTVWGSDGMAMENGALAFHRDPIAFTSGE